jgi:DNA-binding NtrC family response regulator
MAEGAAFILVVDDEPVILRLTSSVLGSAGFRVAVAESATAALETWEPLRREIALVLCDVVMPGMSGLEMANRMVTLDPGVRVLFMSGYTDSEEEVAARQRFPFLRKPFLAEDLVRKVREALDAPLLS